MAYLDFVLARKNLIEEERLIEVELDYGPCVKAFHRPFLVAYLDGFSFLFFF